MTRPLGRLGRLGHLGRLIALFALFASSLTFSHMTAPSADAITCGGEPYYRLYEDPGYNSRNVLLVCYPNNIPNLRVIDFDPDGSQTCNAGIISYWHWGQCVTSIAATGMTSTGARICIYSSTNYTSAGGEFNPPGQMWYSDENLTNGVFGNGQNMNDRVDSIKWISGQFATC